MTNNPLVSIIIPVYNSQEYIKECLESVFAQTYKGYEVVIVDDGSTDLTVSIINDIIKKNKIEKIVLVKQANSGPSAARNNGVKHAHGEYLAFLDSDDQWYPNKLEFVLTEFKKNNTLDIISSLYSIGDNSLFKNTDGSVVCIPLRKLLYRNSLLTSGVVCKSFIFDYFKFDETQKYSEDYRLWLELVASGYKCALINECLLRMNEKPIYGASGLSSKLWLMEKGELGNYSYLYQSGKISVFSYIAASLFSLIKFSRRFIIVRVRNILK